MANTPAVSVATSQGTLRPMVLLVLPVLAEYLLHMLVEYVDLWLTGNFLAQATYVVAITLAGYCLWLLYNLFSFLTLGATALTARFVGAGEVENADRVTNQAVMLGLIWSAILMLLGFLFVGPLIGALNLEGEAADAAIIYLQIILLILPAIMMEEVGIACLRGAGDMMTGLIVMSLVNIVNIIASSALLLGLGPFPELGWPGLAIGTAIAHSAGGIIVLVLLVRGRVGYQLRWAKMRPDRDLMRRLLRIGLPGGLDLLLIVFCQLWFLSIITQLGNLAVAAHGVGVRIEALAYMPGAAFQVAAATLAGQYLGAQDPQRATRSVLLACAFGGSLMALAGVLFFFASVPLSEFFLGGAAQEVVPLSSQLLRMVSFAMIPLAMSMILTGALRGAGDTRWPLVFTFIGLAGIRIPLAYLLAYEEVAIIGTSWTIPGYGLGVVGAWWAMLVDVFIRCGLVTFRFAQGGWKKIAV